MKMVIAIVHNKESGALMDNLVARRFSVTKINTSGGFLRENNATLLMGVEDNRVDQVLEIIRNNCHTRNKFVSAAPPGGEMTGEVFAPNQVEVQVGGATIYVVDVDKYIRL